MYVNSSRYWDSLFISVNNRNDVGAHKKGKEFTLRCVPIFTYKALMIAVFASLYLQLAFSSSCVLLVKGKSVESEGEAGVTPVYWFAFLELVSKRFSKFHFLQYNSWQKRKCILSSWLRYALLSQCITIVSIH